MTKGWWPLKTLLVMTSLSVTLGGWVVLAWNERRPFLHTPTAERRTSAISRHVGILPGLPPIPPLARSAWEGLDSADGAEDPRLALAPIPTLSMPPALPPLPAMKAPSRPLRPIARTRSSR
jgi:hypothetical protein